MSRKATQKYIIFTLAGQHFCVPAGIVDDVISPQRITPVPLAPAYINGILNLRGRVVTMIDLGVCLEIASADASHYRRGIVVDTQEELYGLLAYNVSEVIDFDSDRILPTPDNLSNAWKKLSIGVFNHNDVIVIALDVNKILSLEVA
jgi:purine-binding chemotaxis protein CheW